MCGFAGFLRPGRGLVAGEAERVARAMARRLRSRGPDDEDVFVAPEAGFAVGFRRLAVIDLSPAGRQPMVSADGRFVIAYNGEIYNAAELRRELEDAGVRFRGRSDTEVLLEHLARYGVEATLPRLIGMFAFALFDCMSRELVLARDRIGIKPLLWGRVADLLLFASEASALHAHPAFMPEIDREALALYLRFGYVPGPRTIWRGFAKLPPGHYLRVDRDGREELRCWWDLKAVFEAAAEPLPLRDEEEAADAFEALLADAVARRMVADVPLGVFLSGGLDSSLVAALAARRAGAPVRTFTIGFDAAAFDESAYAREVARMIGAEHSERVCRDADALAIVPRLAGMFDEPFADASAIATALLCRRAREDVTVALSGDGGDELFAGYTRYPDTIRIHGLLLSLPARLRRRLGTALGALAESGLIELGLTIPGVARLKPDERAAKFGEVADAVPERIMRAVISHHTRPERLIPGLREPLEEPWLGGLAPRLRHLPERLQLADMLTYLPDDILTKVDRASMAVGLEVRVPLLDHRVVEFVWRLPRAMRVRDGQPKQLLRRLLARYLPSHLFDRPKHGFSVPIHDWLRGPLAAWIRELVTVQRLHAAGPFDARYVRRLFEEHRTGRVDRRFELWNLLCWLAWHRHWIEREQPVVEDAVVAA
jgi:asparagine synthase (glutamine-hydrolysing)